MPIKRSVAIGFKSVLVHGLLHSPSGDAGLLRDALKCDAVLLVLSSIAAYLLAVGEVLLPCELSTGRVQASTLVLQHGIGLQLPQDFLQLPVPLVMARAVVRRQPAQRGSAPDQSAAGSP